jgi:phage terminase small subunit
MPALENARYESFCAYVVAGNSYAVAYVLAGYKENDGNARSLAARPQVIARVTEMKRIASLRSDVSAGRVLAEYACLAFSDISQVLEGKGKHMTVRDLATLPASVRAAVASVTIGKDGATTVKMHSKAAALDALAKHLSLWRDNVDVNVNVSLADLVNGSYELERGEPRARLVAPAAIEGEAVDVTLPDTLHPPATLQDTLQPKGSDNGTAEV